MAKLKVGTRKLLAARKKRYAGAMYHEIKKFPTVKGVRTDAANSLRRMKKKWGSKVLRNRLKRFPPEHNGK